VRITLISAALAAMLIEGAVQEVSKSLQEIALFYLSDTLKKLYSIDFENYKNYLRWDLDYL